jgi:hypothetical protein
MDCLEGVLLIPPDRGQILGRAVWKPRYVSVSRPAASIRDDQASNASRSGAPGRTASSASKVPPRISCEEYVLSIHKSKSDVEPAHQWPVNSIVDCAVQMVSHRKQGPVLPTLVLTIADKDRKRRSSRTAGLMSTKESSSNTVWFRTSPDNNYPSLHDWARYIMSKKGTMGPDSPVSPNFPSPTPRQDISDMAARPSSGNANSRYDGRSLLHKSSIATQSTGARERPLTLNCESPSLKSKRSDISSPSSSNYPVQHFVFAPSTHDYPHAIPPDMPSPTTTVD